MATEELENILKKLLVPDNAVIQQATLQLKTAFTKPDLVIPALVQLLQNSEDPTIRQYCAILLRRRVVKQWKKIHSDVKKGLKELLLQSVTKESVVFVRASVCQVVGSVARHELSDNLWPELMQFISACVGSLSCAERESGFCLLQAVCEAAPEQLRPWYRDLFPAFQTGLGDAQSNLNAYYVIKCITPLLQFFGSDEEVLLKPMLGQIMIVVKALLKQDEDKANEALDIFDELVQIEVGIIVPYVKSLVEFCMQIMSCGDLSEALRVKALYLVCWACRRKSKTLLKAKLLKPLVTLLLSLMAIPNEDEENDEEADEMNNLQSVAGQALDLLALHVSPEKIIPLLMESLSPLFGSTNPYERKAAYIALGELAEGCADFIRNRYLQNAIDTAMKGLSDESFIVRNAALFALGQYAEHVQPEVGKFHEKVLPLLLSFLQTVINSGGEADVKHKGTLTKLFYAIEKFTEGLDKEIVSTHTNGLMEAFLSLLKISKDSHTTELAISAIGALVTSAQDHLTVFFPIIMEHLKVYLTQPLTIDTMDVHAQTVDTLGALARYISRDAFLPVAAECMQFGIKMIEDCDDPDLRRCTYGLFASLSVVLKDGMSEYLPTICPVMILSLKSTEGIVANYDSNNDPSFLVEDDVDEDISTDDNNDDDDEDEDGIAGYSVENAYMEEKEDTINSLAEITENVGNAMMPFIEEIFKEIFLLIEYPHSNVRKASVTAGCRLCVALHKILKENNATDFKPVHDFVSRTLPTSINIINMDDDRYVVIACVEVLDDFLKVIKGDAFIEKKHIDELANAILNVLKGKIHAQEFLDEDDSSTVSGDEDGTQAELDQMLIEKTGDLLPSFAQAIGGEHFKVYFKGFLPELMKRTKKNSAVSERSFAAGTVAEILQAMGLSVCEFVETLAPWLMALLQDEDDEVRSNSAFALGVLAENAKDAAIWLYGNMLQVMFGLLSNQQQPPLVQDNICGAVSRMILTAPQALPMDQVLPVLVGCLPVKEDERENETVTKCFLQLYSSNTSMLLPYMEKLIPWFIASVKDEKSGLETETREKVKMVVSDIQTKYPTEFAQVVSSVN
ncbi:importin-4-like [Hydractinia symbiolongicarpus]|uniref:importin-4-like n=1 Tax=Hydractinia symbiolongicarpus TaxID=13093 RepID=UPI00254FC172|nr:importin-4-like [Hydractinia symbiolongicarpus]